VIKKIISKLKDWWDNCLL